MNSEAQDQEAEDVTPFYLIHICTPSRKVQIVRSKGNLHPRNPDN